MSFPVPQGLKDYFTASRLQNQQAGEFASSHLKREIALRGEERAEFTPLRKRFIANVGNKDRRMSQRLQGSISSQVAQQFNEPATNFADAISASTRKAKIRGEISNRGENAIKNQQLRDRIAIMRSGQKRRGAIQDALSQATNIREGVNVGVANANQAIANSNADLAGGITGSVLAGIKNGAFSFGKTTTPGTT